MEYSYLEVGMELENEGFHFNPHLLSWRKGIVEKTGCNDFLLRYPDNTGIIIYPHRMKNFRKPESITDKKD